MFRTACFLAVLLGLVCVNAHPFSNCGSSSDVLSVSSVSIRPDPPVAGQKVTVTLNGTVSATETEGDAAITVKYLGIAVINENLNLCKLTTCPVKANTPFSGDYNIDVPSYAPSGEYDATITVKDGSGKQLGCLELTFNL